MVSAHPSFARGRGGFETGGGFRQNRPGFGVEPITTGWTRKQVPQQPPQNPEPKPAEKPAKPTEKPAKHTEKPAKPAKQQPKQDDGMFTIHD
ncbi:unnamed protein product [Dibothriocephalus latus]|uniref:Uncharacterized protein n=1 Tax=Dibothriocephalus latus TaxID=60516 RepID=A0A3P7PB95_DIBLA|nr:unnamed protein product [Dibothriocephalus latus]